MRTRIRCPLCGQLVWENSFKKGPYPIEAKGMKGAGKAKGFTFYPIDDISFLARVKSFLMERIETIAQQWQLGLTTHQNKLIEELELRCQNLKNQILNLQLENQNLQTSLSNVLTQAVPSTSSLKKMEQEDLLSNRKTNALWTTYPKTSTNNSQELLQEPEKLHTHPVTCLTISK